MSGSRTLFFRPLSLLALVASVSTSSRAHAENVCLVAAEKAESLRSKERLVQAKAELVKCSSADCPRPVQTACLRWLDEVKAALPSVVVRAVDRAGMDVLEGTVVVDGTSRATLGFAAELDPGPHTITVRRGAEHGEVKLLIAEGERNRVVLVTLSAQAGPAAAPPAGAAMPAAEPQRAPAVQSPPGPGPLPFIAFGVGALGLVSFGVLQVMAQSQYDDLKGSCGNACNPDDVDAIRTKVILSAVGLGVGLVGVGGGVGLLLFSGPSSSATLRLTPRVAGADLSLRF
jgi:hypothetical protein